MAVFFLCRAVVVGWLGVCLAQKLGVIKMGGDDDDDVLIYQSMNTFTEVERTQIEKGRDGHERRFGEEERLFCRGGGEHIGERELQL